MYKTKPRFPCNMPSDAPLNVLALNASLKHEPAVSNTGELADLVLAEVRALASVHTELVRLSDLTLPVGLGFREADKDDWPDLVAKIKAADIVLRDLRLANGIGGKGVVVLSGPLSEVQASVERGRADAQQRGLLARAVIIPRMDARLRARLV